MEDVKILLSLLPVIFCAGGCNVDAYVGWEKLLIEELLFGKSKAILAHTDVFHLIMVVLGIPLYRFPIYPFFYNYIPTMLKLHLVF